MKEKGLVAGGRRWHGVEFVEIQKENLDVIQGMFGTIGACVISGCTVGFSGSFLTISPGIVCIYHADGWKVARFSGLTSGGGVSLGATRYLTISKATNNKLYNNGSNLLKEYDYTATLQSIVSGTENVDYLTVSLAGGIRSLRQAMSFAEAFTTVSVVGIGVGSISANFKYRKNILNNTLELIGTATLGNNAAIPSSGVWDVIVTLPAGYRPITQQAHFVALPISNTWNANSTDYLNPITVKLSTAGDLQVFFQKAASGVTNYSVSFSVIIPLA